MAVTFQRSNRTNWAAVIEGCLLIGIGTMLLRKTWDGVLPMYIHPRYTILVGITAVVVLLIGVFRLWQSGETPQPLRGRIGIYGLLLAPLLLGVMIPAAPAGSALVDPQQLNVSRRGYRTPSNIDTSTTHRWTLFDWMLARYMLKPEEITGKPADVVGFVYHAKGQPADEFYVVRYMVACCVADRTGVSLPVKWADAASLPSDRWVRVTGTIEPREVAEGKTELVVVNAQVEVVTQPDEPYLYP